LQLKITYIKYLTFQALPKQFLSSRPLALNWDLFNLIFLSNLLVKNFQTGKQKEKG